MKDLDALKVLAIDEIANAKSGHPGMAISASPIVYSLYKKMLNVVPSEPKFINRDRVVFSAGHCSALVYAILHLCGYDVSLNDLMKFRKFGSITAGHPEVDLCPGVDATTGPLGQGIAMAVGMAMAERHLASRFNKPDIQLIDHYTYAICGEGCLMEGVSYEACSLAGTNKLNKLIIIYDCNKITMDGSSELALQEDLCKRFEAQGFSTFVVEKAGDIEGICEAIAKAKTSDKPSFIVVPSIIGEGTKVAGTNKAHGTPLSLEEAVEFRTQFGFSNNLFDLPSEIVQSYHSVFERGEQIKCDYAQKLVRYKRKYRKLFKEFSQILENQPSVKIKLDVHEEIAGRDLGQYALREVNKSVPNLFGGTADLMTSTKAYLIDESDFSSENYAGKNIHFGVREFSMNAICNGIALHGGLVPFCSTFLVFSDYMKASIRLSAIMKQKVIYIFSHDSIEVGEDGPTHQPIEQLDALRSIPNLQVFRPCCGAEVAFAYEQAISYQGPTAIILSKNKLPVLNTKRVDFSKGAFLVHKTRLPIANIIATGLEVGLALQVVNELQELNKDANVISIVNKRAFDLITEKERNKIIDKSIKTNVVIEASSANAISNLAGLNGLVFNINEFGASGSKTTLYNYYGFNPKAIANAIIEKSLKNGDSIIPLYS